MNKQRPALHSGERAVVLFTVEKSKRGEQSAVLLFAFTVELVRIIYIVPYTVEAACDGGYGSHECVAHPNGEYRVLLS